MGKRILVLRTEPGATATAKELEQLGHATHSCPLLTIEKLPLLASQHALLEQLHRFDGIILVSFHAARLLADWLAAQRQIDLLPGTAWYAVGAASAAPLQRAGLHPRMPTTGFSTEGLLDLPELQNAAGLRILIVRGEGGRETLAATLTERGAKVRQLALYRRIPNLAAQARLPELLAATNLVFAGSGEMACALANLIEVTAFHRPLLVPSERVKAISEAQGLRRVIAIDGMSAQAIHNWIQRHAR